MTTTEVAGQIATQTGLSVRFDRETEESPARWEADGKEQTVAEVLGILQGQSEWSWTIYDDDLWILNWPGWAAPRGVK